MATEEMDLAFPKCCSACPHLELFTGSCGHNLRQSLLQELTDKQPCPVYTATKTEAMQQLTDSV